MKKLDLHSYTIYFEEVQKALSRVLNTLHYTSLFVLVDENTKEHCLPLVQKALPDNVKYIEVKSGELHKDLSTCEHIWSSLLEKGADRQSILINLGGGVIGDMGGFCASTYMRGIRFIQIPTTLLSQVDASVGSKLGVDFMKVKNIIGLFQDPIAVLIDPTFLKTLSITELRSGYAEIIKHALIRDVSLWEMLQSISSVHHDIVWDEIIYLSVEIKHEIVQQDRKESSLRKILNFGHTIGHALESFYLNTETPLLHGEAIAWGMYAEIILSKQQFSLSDAAVEKSKAYIRAIYGDKRPAQWDTDALISYMKRDKKNKAGKISFSLLNRIGDCQTDLFVEEYQLKDLFKTLSI